MKPKELQEALISGLQKVQIDEDDVADEVGSLAQSAEALRLTAAAPPRNNNAAPITRADLSPPLHFSRTDAGTLKGIPAFRFSGGFGTHAGG